MKTTFKSLVCGIIILSLTMSSCSKDSEQGDIGPIGPTGPQGVQGEKGDTGETGAAGAPGQDGANGTNGSNGTNGADGADGNANVKVYKYNFRSDLAASFYMNVPPITAEVLANDGILCFIKIGSYNYPLPGRYLIYDMYNSYTTGIISIGVYESGTSNPRTPPAGVFKQLMVVIIKSSNITGKSNSNSVLTDLKNNGVDIKDYNALMNHFGLAY